MARQLVPAGAARQQIARDVALFNPAEQVFQAMLDGWRNQQLSRNLSFTTIARREQVIQRFRSFTGEDPWAWTVGDVDEFFMELRAVRSASHSTLLAYQNALRLFLGYLTDPAYGWDQECVRAVRHPPGPGGATSGTPPRTSRRHEPDPRQAAVHPRRAAGLFDYADDQVDHVREPGRKGWLPAFRDATLFKVAYAYGLRRNEIRMLDLADFGTNPHAPRVRRVRRLLRPPRQGEEGLAAQAPQRADSLAVGRRRPEAVDRARSGRCSAPTRNPAALWPSERGGRVGADAAEPPHSPPTATRSGSPTGLDFHSLRRSYVTHLIEDGWDAAVRPATGRTRTRLHHRDLHLRLLRLPHPHPAGGHEQVGRRGHRHRPKEDAMKKHIEYSWRLREIMAARGLFNISDLIPLLVERGIELSPSQIYRLVGQKPERMSMTLLGALCDALDCTVEDLCQFHTVATAQRKSAVNGPKVVDLNTTIRPKRARVRPAD